MQIFEIAMRIRLKEDVYTDQALEKIGSILDQSLCQSGFLTFHKENTYKNYCFNSFYPLEKDKKYLAGKFYMIQVRTPDPELASCFTNKIKNMKNSTLQIVKTDLHIIAKHMIEKIYSITPCILKTDTGYWRKNETIELYEKRLTENLLKKYHILTGKRMNENFQFCSMMEFHNKKPITCQYKNIHFLGDKVCLYIADSKEAQELAYMALGTGILEMNARGYGYMNYQWL